MKRTKEEEQLSSWPDLPLRTGLRVVFVEDAVDGPRARISDKTRRRDHENETLEVEPFLLFQEESSVSRSHSHRFELTTAF